MMKINLNRSLIFSWTIVFTLLTNFISFAQPKIKFDLLEYTMNPVKRGEKVELKIPFKNIGNEPLFIEALKASVPTLIKPQNLIYPNETDSITVKIPTHFIGKSTHNIIVETNSIDSITILKVNLEVIDNLSKERLVSGIVKDSIGIIPGVNVLIEGTNKSVQTDFDGKYSIKATPDEFIIFSFTGFKDTRVKANELEINVILKGGIQLKEVNGPAYFPQSKSRPQTTTISVKELTTSSNPKQHFKSNAKKNVFIVYVSNLSSLTQTDFEFQKNYNITYLPYNTAYSNYFKKYNLFTFKSLNKKYKTIWQSEIRKDAIGLDNFIKK
ncbi:FEKKY domain-containing protein [Flavobacterium capsici]|uniref:Carboxypeptidase-like regulatory domain-containing protein n=1 Tax=Flavobacterium capsici TaxID=3075618 RepID=A0AA96EUL8_9FLAO|nr:MULTISPECIES: carboxypeptidase-like regulatory domain-containing protein [unclassified Flavobacterium]WNM18067.1 carboxypeptidase-like regulatory domain-containing protein [Flavobacterium sp. PMR2A8]WNM22119.1 carboxypeptidase-like regulatory domain-containing protein [Flavobacterium sp. PMTSA4]